MIVPAYWSEAIGRASVGEGRQRVRRMGWSDESQARAEAHAQARLADALQRLAAGEAIEPNERRAPYNAGEGVPIREEIIQRRGETVVTRNSYGALCLNTPNVLFADIDHADEPPLPWTCGIALACGALAGAALGVKLGALAALLSGLATTFLMLPAVVHVFRLRQRAGGGPEVLALARARRAVASGAADLVDVYRTPAGMRLLVRDRTFDPTGPQARAFLESVDSDRLFVALCVRQRCFRARVSPKPWRMGLRAQLKPRPGVWPVDPSRLPERRQWVEAYERASERFASVEFLETLGEGVESEAVRPVRELHDELARARSGLPIA